MGNTGNRSWIAGVLAVVALVALIGGQGILARCTADTVMVTVTKTERITTGSGDSLSHKYLVFTNDETFENTDCLWYGKFNSSDVQGRLTPGRYRMKVHGWRIQLLSQYRNIVTATPAG